MDKVSKWFIALFGLNKKPTKPNPAKKPPKKRWPFMKHTNNNINKDHHHHHNQAVVAAAEPTNDHLTKQFSGTTAFSGGEDGNYVPYVSRSRDSYGGRDVWAAVKIQSHFRAYLSRRALRALKSLVKLQALVRGHIVRKQTANTIRRVHVLLRVQAKALARRSTMSSGKLKPLDHLNLFSNPEDGYYYYTSLTPTTSDFSRSDQSCFSEHPNYMSYTESSKAKMRSLSAPKQRLQYERLSSSSARRREYPYQISYDFRFNHHKISELQAKFANKLYPGSGRLGNLGVATRGNDHLYIV